MHILGPVKYNLDIVAPQSQGRRVMLTMSGVKI